MSFYLEHDYTLYASHILRNHKGKCQHLHGHCYLISLTFVADSLRGDDCNFIIDTYDIDAYLDEYFGGSDHCDLEEVFSEPNCSMEWMSKRMYDDLKEKFLKNDIKLYSVTVQETKGSRCTYRK